MKNNRFDNRFNYYFYGTNCDVDVMECFNNGIDINNEKVFQHLYRSDIYGDDIDSYILNCVKRHNYDKVFVIKIPSYYVGWRHRDGKIEPFVPFLISSEDKTFKKIVPCLIHGVYNSKSGNYLENEYYDSLYDPCGLHYSDEQLKIMYKFGLYNEYKTAVQRNTKSFEILQKKDEEDNAWERITNHYSYGKVTRVLKRIKNLMFSKTGR